MNVDFGSDGCMYNYVVTAHKPTNVNHSIVGHFTSPTDVNLIISKFTRIEIHTLTTEGLQGVVDVPIYGRVSVLELFRPHNEPKDLLFVFTERYKFCVLEYESRSGELITRANGDLQDRVGRPCDNGQLGIMDPKCKMIGLHMYDGLFKVIPLDERGSLQEAFNIRLEELTVIDIQFLHACQRPTIALLYQDSKDARHIKTYEVSLKEKDLNEGPWAHNHLDGGAGLIIPVPAPFGGAIVLGESVITYLSERQPMKCIALNQTIMKAYGKVDEDGSRYLLGDYQGVLYLLVLAHDGERVVGLKLEQLGRVTTPSTLTYLDNGVVFVGSTSGDSQLIRLHAQPPDPLQPNCFVEVLDSITNLGPIVDFEVVDLDRQGQGQVVTCSGIAHDGSLRIVRNGIGVLEQAAVELAGIKGVWSLRTAWGAAHDTFLVLSFVGETRLLAINDQDELDEAEVEGFDVQTQTLWCGNALGDQWVQAGPAALRLVGCDSGKLLSSWTPPGGKPINIVAASPSQLLVAVGGSLLVLLAVASGQLLEQAQLQLQQEVSCLDITPIGGSAERSKLAAVGSWDMKLSLYQLPSMSPLTTTTVGSEVIPRSVLFSSFEGNPYLLCALGDGHLINFRVNPDSGVVSERKQVSLGTKPITLTSFSSKGQRYVFAASDRPTIIYSNNGKLLYSNLNENEVNFMASFHSASFPDSLAIAKESSLTIGGIDEVQKLHIRTVPLHEQPRRIAYQESSRTFLLAVTRTAAGVVDEMGEESLRLLDEQTFDTLQRHQLSTHEVCCSIASLQLAEDDTNYYVVGTAVALPEEEEPTRGRILVFRVREQKLVVVADKETRGAVYTLLPFQGKLLATINSRVQLYRWGQRMDSSRELLPDGGYNCNVMALYAATQGDFIIVGDLMKSMQLLRYKCEEAALEMRASDPHSHWMSAVEVLDDDTFLGAENSYNLFTLRKNSDSASDEERNRLETVGEYHLGEFVNRFRKGSLVMTLPDSELAHLPTLLYGSVNGVIGVIASIPRAQFLFLDQLQDALRKVVKGVGGLDHRDWRSFSSEKGVQPCRGFIDGDLVEQFLDLSQQGMESVVKFMSDDVTVEQVYKMVEELSRLH